MIEVIPHLEVTLPLCVLSFFTSFSPLATPRLWIIGTAIEKSIPLSFLPLGRMWEDVGEKTLNYTSNAGPFLPFAHQVLLK